MTKKKLIGDSNGYGKLTAAEKKKFVGRELCKIISQHRERRVFTMSELKDLIRNIIPKRYTAYNVGMVLKFQYDYKVFKRISFNTSEFVFVQRTASEKKALMMKLNNWG